ncbi:MAG: hypothetical protein J0G96_06860 [Flavobacteriia bacterium]|nr:hypothetical protein [Flavobacteriia bacterium]OJX39131.1 MAG: hypothetical protein BGO87_03875 [Flavobacteriia bacterium 40-80]
MIKWIKNSLLLMCILSGGWLYSQEESDMFYMSSVSEIDPKHSVTMELGLPVVLSNKFNRTFMDGLIYFAPYYQYSFRNHLSIGAGIFYNFIKINAVTIAENVHGGNNTFGFFFKMSHEKFHSTRFATDFGVKVGAAQAMYSSNKLKDAGITSTDTGFYIEPNLGFILTAAEKSSFRFFLGYNITTIPFSNTTIGMSSNGGMSGKDFRKVQQFLTIGFGYTFYAKTR